MGPDDALGRWPGRGQGMQILERGPNIGSGAGSCTCLWPNNGLACNQITNNERQSNERSCRVVRWEVGSGKWGSAGSCQKQCLLRPLDSKKCEPCRAMRWGMESAGMQT